MRRRLDAIEPQDLAEAHDAPLQDLVRRRGRVLSPDCVDQLLGADGVTRAHCQRRQDHPVPPTQIAGARHDLPGAAVNGGDTRAIPRQYRPGARSIPGGVTTEGVRGIEPRFIKELP